MRKASKMIYNDCTIRIEPEEKLINLNWNITNSMERFKNENWVWYFALVRKIDIKQFGGLFSFLFSLHKICARKGWYYLVVIKNIRNNKTQKFSLIKNTFCFQLILCFRCTN